MPWINVPTNMTTVTAGTYDTAWQAWTSQTTSSSITVQNGWIWQRWNGTTGAQTIVLPRTVADSYYERQYAAMQQRYDAEYRQQQAAYEARLRIEMESRAIVNSKALALLLSLLSPEQRAQFESPARGQVRYFDCIGHHSKRRYRIKEGSHGNIYLMEGDRAVTKYCAQPEGVPLHDSMLAQKFQIEADEEAFLAVANATRVA